MNIKLDKTAGMHREIARSGTKGKISERVLGKVSQPVISESGRQAVIDQLNLLRQSLNKPDLMKIELLKRGFPPLNQVFLILEKSSMDPRDIDFQLIEKFIGSWLKKYGDLLPDRRRQELIILKNLLSSSVMDERAEEEARVCYNNFAMRETEKILWNITIGKKNKNSEKNAEYEKPECLLNLSYPHLGEIDVQLSSGKKQVVCNFFSSRSTIVKAIRKSLSSFKKQLLGSSVPLPLFQFSHRKRDKSSGSEKRKEKGVRLWV